MTVSCRIQVNLSSNLIRIVSRKIILLILVIFIQLTVIETAFENVSSISFAVDKEIVWELIGPGDADQVTSISVGTDGLVYVGIDIGGIYYSSNNGESWSPINNGIKNYDITTPVLIDPENRKNLYVGTRGGFYKSDNEGKTWQSKWKGVSSGSPAYSNLTACVGSIAIDPQNPKIIFMGFGYRPSSLPDEGLGLGVLGKVTWSGDIYRSSDKGETWKVMSSLGKGVKIRHIKIVSSEIIYISTDSGLFKSEDGGKSWGKIINVSAKFIAVHPENFKIVYLAAGEEGIYKSQDAGEHWVKMVNGLSLNKGTNPPFSTDNYPQIVIDTKNHDVLYTMSSTWGSGGGVYKSSNAGDLWEKITKWQLPLAPHKEVNVEEAWLESSRKINAIAIDSQNTNRIFIGTSRYIYKTDDGGKSWQQLISRKITNDTWTHRGINVFGHTRVVGIDPVDFNRLYIGTGDHGLVKSIDGGKSWKESVKGMGYKDNIYDIVIDAKKPQVVYVVNGKVGFKAAGVAKSYDFGENWIQLNTGLKEAMYYTLLLDSENSDVAYLGGEGGVYKTDDSGKKWALKNKGIESVTVSKLVVHPKNKEIIFAATDKGLYKTVDSGNSWAKTHANQMNLRTVVVDPNQPDIIYVGAIQMPPLKQQGGVFKSTDGGRKWINVLSVRRIGSMAILPTQPAIIYAVSNDDNYHDESSGKGVFRSIDGGLSWKSVNDGLPVLRGFNINVAPNPPYKLYLSSNGSGAYVAIDPITESAPSQQQSH